MIEPVENVEPASDDNDDDELSEDIVGWEYCSAIEVNGDELVGIYETVGY